MVRTNRIWRSEIAHSLLDRSGASTVEEAITKLVDAKLSLIGTLKTPIDLKMVASLYGISSQFNYIQLTEAARLRPDGRGRYVIDVNTNHNKARQRFSIAHEIGHKALLDHGIRITKHRGSALYTQEQREEEEICDAIATTLLGLRPEYVQMRLDELDLTFMAIEQMSHECETSFEATLRAVLRHCEHAAAGVYCRMYGKLTAGIVDTFLLHRAYYSHHFTSVFSADYLFSGVTCLREAIIQNGTVITTDETFTFNNVDCVFHAEAKQITIYVDQLPKVGVVMLLSRS